MDYPLPGSSRNSCVGSVRRWGRRTPSSRRPTTFSLSHPWGCFNVFTFLPFAGPMDYPLAGFLRNCSVIVCAGSVRRSGLRTPSLRPPTTSGPSPTASLVRNPSSGGRVGCTSHRHSHRWTVNFCWTVFKWGCSVKIDRLFKRIAGTN